MKIRRRCVRNHTGDTSSGVEDLHNSFDKPAVHSFESVNKTRVDVTRKRSPTWAVERTDSLVRLAALLFEVRRTVTCLTDCNFSTGSPICWLPWTFRLVVVDSACFQPR